MNDLPKSVALEAAIREAKDGLKPKDVDWAPIEASLMDRIEAHKPALVTDLAVSPTRARVTRLGALAFAAAAALAIVVRRDRDTPLEGGAPATAETASAGTLRSTEGAGEVRVGGVLAMSGHVLRAGDAIEADGAKGLFERPRKVIWLLESERPSPARARLRTVADALVVALEDGAIEAQVTPVPSGEAFAVDVATEHGVVRVAVHGTHLRVARTGTRVTVDLTEGAVSIGVPPRSGPTYGKLVTAPAHVELDASDVAGTLRVDHTPSSVRAPLSLGAHDAPLPARAEPVPPAARPTAQTPPPARTTAPASASAAAKAEAPRTAPVPPKEAVASAIRACAAAHSRPTEIRVTVTSTLRLRVSSSGDVESAQFDPPLLPDVQKCAAEAIYRTKLEGEGGTIAVPIQFSY